MPKPKPDSEPIPIADWDPDIHGPLPETTAEDDRKDADWCHIGEDPDDDPSKWPPGLGPNADMWQSGIGKELADNEREYAKRTRPQPSQLVN